MLTDNDRVRFNTNIIRKGIILKTELCVHISDRLTVDLSVRQSSHISITSDLLKYIIEPV
jgi:hypothetical protein